MGGSPKQDSKSVQITRAVSLSSGRPISPVSSTYLHEVAEGEFVVENVSQVNWAAGQYGHLVLAVELAVCERFVVSAIHTHTHMHTHTRTHNVWCTHAHTHMHAHMHARMLAHTHTHTQRHKHTHTHTHTSHKHMYALMYKYHHRLTSVMPSTLQHSADWILTLAIPTKHWQLSSTALQCQRSLFHASLLFGTRRHCNSIRLRNHQFLTFFSLFF